MAKFDEQRALTSEGILRYVRTKLEHGEDILVLNIVNKFDTVLFVLLLYVPSQQLWSWPLGGMVS